MNNCEETEAPRSLIEDWYRQSGRLPSKRRFAFYQSFERLWALSSEHYFWTFTPDGHVCDEGFLMGWKLFLDRWRYRRGGTLPCGLRVFEPFQSGELHAHAVINEWVSVNLLRDLARNTNIGPVMQVRRAWSGDAHYLAKYMTKTQRRLASRRRVWAKFGPWAHCRVRDVQVGGAYAELMRFAYQVVAPIAKSQKRRWFEAKLLGEQLHRRWLVSGVRPVEKFIAALKGDETRQGAY